MKTLSRLFITFISILTMGFLISCSSDKKDDNNPLNPGTNSDSKITMSLNGDGFVNQSITLSNGISTYSGSENSTAIAFNGKVGDDSLFFYIVFSGNQSGTKNWDTNNGVIMYKSNSGNNLSYMGISNGTIVVSTYGSVGSKVSGTLSGQIINTSTSNTVGITNGSFAGTRITDVP